MIPGDKACYPGTDVLINKFDIRDFDKARAAEYKFAAARELQLAESPIKGKFDFAHLQAIHKHVFQDMYEWAGQMRDIDFAKRSKETGLVTKFIPSIVMDLKIEDFNKFMAEKNQLKGLSKPDFIKAMAEVHTRLNELHPFREGNGRSTRIFLKQLAREAGYEFDITKVEKDRWNLASHMALPRHDPKKPDEKHFPNQIEIRQIFHEACKPVVAEKENSSPVYNNFQQPSAYTGNASVSRGVTTADKEAQARRKQENTQGELRGAFGFSGTERADKALPHAVAFDKLPPREAFERFPELEGAYRVLAQAQKFAAMKLNSAADRSKFFNQVRAKVSAELHQGREVSLTDFGRDR